MFLEPLSLLSIHNPILLVFLAAGLVRLLDLIPGDE
jgi:hypothetical protein